MKLVLLAEDDQTRGQAIQALLPTNVRCVWARSAGAAIGVLRRDTFAAVLLDHDLESRPESTGLDGQAVAKAVCETQIPGTCRVLIHSQNSIGSAAMVQILLQAGFCVDKCAWSAAATPLIRQWIEENLPDE